MIQHFLTELTGSGFRLANGRIDGRRPVGVDALPPGSWQNYTYGPAALCLVRVETTERLLSEYAAQPGVLYAFPVDLSEVLRDSDAQTTLEGVGFQHSVPVHWLSQGMTQGEILRRLFRTFTLAQRLRGVSKIGLADHLDGGRFDLDTPWADLPVLLRTGLVVAADTLALDKTVLSDSRVTLKEALFETSRSLARDPWQKDPPRPPGTITDNFNRAALGANWTNGPGSWADMAIIGSVQLAPAVDATLSACYYSAAAWDNDQTSEGTCAANVGYEFPGSLVRCAADGDCYYVDIQADTGAWSLHLVVNGSSFTDIVVGSFFTQFLAGDTLKLGVVGTTLTVYRNGGADATTGTDGTYASGSPGLGGYGQAGAWADWAGEGNLSTTAPKWQQYARRRRAA